MMYGRQASALETIQHWAPLGHTSSVHKDSASVTAGTKQHTVNSWGKGLWDRIVFRHLLKGRYGFLKISSDLYLSSVKVWEHSI